MTNYKMFERPKYVAMSQACDWWGGCMQRTCEVRNNEAILCCFLYSIIKMGIPDLWASWLYSYNCWSPLLFSCKFGHKIHPSHSIYS
jgi:hypothetical protein